MTLRMIVNRKELEAVRLTYADEFCSVERAHNSEKPWKFWLVFEDGPSIVKAYRSLADRIPKNVNRAIPYKSVCRKLAVLLLGDVEERGHAHGK